MKPFSRFINKLIGYIDYRLFVKRWQTGITRHSIQDIIRTKTFDPDINWMRLPSLRHEQADPFIFKINEDRYGMFVEDIKAEDGYGKIALITLDDNFRKLSDTVVLDTHSHLSFPFIYQEQERLFVFPESGKSGQFSCYEYKPQIGSLNFVKVIIDAPLLDAVIIRRNSNYFIIGSLKNTGAESTYVLVCYYANELLGPYKPHPANPIKTGLDGIRGAGNFIEVDGELFRPSQNCKDEYGKSITINRIKKLDEFAFEEEFYMEICINKKNKLNRGIHTIHTINWVDDVLVVDGIEKVFMIGGQNKILSTQTRS